MTEIGGINRIDPCLDHNLVVFASRAQLEAHGGVDAGIGRDPLHTVGVPNVRAVSLLVGGAACSALFASLAGLRAMPTPFQVECLMLSILLSGTMAWLTMPDTALGALGTSKKTPEIE
ncbi:hypothetical protein [Nocardia sp. NPDC049149]|uniref:hypothetical protein n=1 Tax=Nocardia sp. NPDC049149 TaxID=3364315 RepID=UPI00371221F8